MSSRLFSTVLMTVVCLLVVVAVANDGATCADDPTSDTSMPADWTTWRVGGDLFATTEQNDNGEYSYGRMRVEAPLPEGYPAPTPPGAIELKRYPSVRRAEITREGNTRRGSNAAFWPLFQHIKERDIAMTSPVEMDYENWTGEAGDAPGRWTMSFLYRTPDLGPTGDDGDIRVIDTDPVAVVSIGMRGPYELAMVEKGLHALEQWLASQSEWVAAGAIRSFSYNGPYIPDRDKWSEVQMEVRRAETD